MAAQYLKLIIQKGGTFARTLLFGTGPLFTVAGAADAEGGLVRFSATGHPFTVGDQVKLLVRHPARHINYLGSYPIAAAVAGVSFDVACAWQGSGTGTVQLARDLTGLALRGQVKADYDSVAVLLPLTCAIAAPLTGVATIGAASDLTGAAPVTTAAVHAVELYDTATPPLVEPLLYGDVEIRAEGI
jgi:hypothetical protein